MQRRYSRQRELILNYVKQSREHPTADMVYQNIKPSIPNLSRGTVYRNLNLLVEDGELVQIPLPVDRYDGRTEPHSHFFCNCCGNMTDLDYSYQQELDNQLSAQTGMKIQWHSTIFYGLCLDCAARETLSEMA